MGSKGIVIVLPKVINAKNQMKIKEKSKNIIYYFSHHIKPIILKFHYNMWESHITLRILFFANTPSYHNSKEVNFIYIYELGYNKIM
jgi:hypothetical protein